MNRTTWLRLERWYTELHSVHRWLTKIGFVLFIICCVILVTHEPSERKRISKIILNCDHCGADPERTISYNEYMDRKEQEQRTWIASRKQELRQQIWDDNGRARWCRNHPQDRNCQ